ncbi:endolytic transglycosylase MltG [Orrella sp. 11846]|uniref:endolytic transglycosylase MltG n=1 Tax=Orrella sp. 11846 TaxID=3409913 RepID=UPI003B5B9BE3
MRWMIKTLLVLLLLAVIAAGALAGYAWHWVHQPLALSATTIDVRVARGAGLGAIADTLIEHGVTMPREAFIWLARLSEKDRLIKAGGYQISEGESLWDVLNKMASGDVSQRQVAFIEGWTVPQVLQTLQNHPDITKTLSDELLADQTKLSKHLGLNETYLEGWLFPDTYLFPVGSTDEEILRRAVRTQQEILQKAWDEREEGLPLKSPYEALILASIIEKETGRHAERARIAGVFINRLKTGMPLQTDPTVIYGMGDLYQGRIRKADLQRDTPWNTYTRNGLPPSPISTVSRASLEAVLHPEAHDYYYFVARGDGSSEFAKNLRDHNRNVSMYILGKGKPPAKPQSDTAGDKARP